MMKLSLNKNRHFPPPFPGRRRRNQQPLPSPHTPLPAPPPPLHPPASNLGAGHPRTSAGSDPANSALARPVLATWEAPALGLPPPQQSAGWGKLRQGGGSGALHAPTCLARPRSRSTKPSQAPAPAGPPLRHTPPPLPVVSPRRRLPHAQGSTTAPVNSPRPDPVPPGHGETLSRDRSGPVPQFPRRPNRGRALSLPGCGQQKRRRGGPHFPPTPSAGGDGDFLARGRS